ncbi:MAG: hypothetical protein ACI7YS_00030 [Flavobacterium sp.]
MKKLSLLAFLLFVNPGFSQEQKEKREKLEMNVFLGFGYNFNDSFAIDSKLQSSGIPSLPENIPKIIVGLGAHDKKLFFDTELTINIPKKESNSDISILRSTADIRGRFHYNFTNNNSGIFSGGLNLAFATNYMSIYDNKNHVDLNNINVNDSKYIYLYNYMIYTGPSLSFAIKNKKGLLCRINTSYEIAFASSKWKSQIADVSNSLDENGHDRIMIGGVFYLFQNHKKWYL